MNRCLLALTTLVSSFSLSGCDEDADRVETYGFADPIEQVDIRTGFGDIEVQEDPSAEEAIVRAEVYGEATDVVAELEDGALKLSHRCPKRYRACGVEWLLILPPADGVRTFEARTGAGDIDVFDTQGAVRADTGAGDIGLHDVVATQVDLETGSGDIGARVGGELESVRIRTGSGDVGLRVPEGVYQVSIETGAGDVSTRGVSNDDASARRIDVDTGAGDVVLRGG